MCVAASILESFPARPPLPSSLSTIPRFLPSALARACRHPHPLLPPAVALCPSQDSFLLVDALAAEWDTTFRTRPPRVAVEVGCGTGYVIASAALLASASGIVPGDAVPGDGGDGEIDRVQNAAAAAAAAFAYYATDINQDALATTRATLRNHGIADERVELTRGDLLGPLRERLRGKIDLLLFNPPYVLTPSEEVRARVEP